MAVGDPLQLAPTISNFSEKESEGGLGKTMFIRLSKSPVHL